MRYRPECYLPPTEAAWRRFHRQRKYKSKGLPLETYKLIASQDCTYCGAKPIRQNPWSATFERASQLFKGITREWYDSQFICLNGVDKVIPADNYQDISNLVACCKKCNFLKGTLDKEEFLNQINKVYNHQHQKKV